MKKKKELFLKFFLFCCHLKIKIILLKTTYRNITLKFVGRYFTCLLKYFPKNRTILVQKLRGEKSCQNPFSAILKKVPMAIKLEGGGGG